MSDSNFELLSLLRRRLRESSSGFSDFSEMNRPFAGPDMLFAWWRKSGLYFTVVISCRKEIHRH